MTDKFKQQLKDLADGKLSALEQAEVEREMEKLELYQAYMDEMLEGSERESKAVNGESERSIELNPKQAKKLMQQGKRRARYWNVGTVFGLLLLLSIINSVIISLFYSIGDPSRTDIYRDVVRSAIQVTSPNVQVGLSSGPAGILGMKFSGPLTKKIGSEQETIGMYSQKFRLNQMLGSGTDTHTASKMVFYAPHASSEMSAQEWKRLEKLPEGTVAEAFISLDQFYETDTALKLFQNKEMEPLWLAVYKGEFEGTENEKYEVAMEPIGFPTTPMWHYGDGERTVQQEKKPDSSRFQKMTITRYPIVEVYGDGKLREDNFKETLRLLQKYKSVAHSIVSSATINQTLNYVETNGVRIYGVAVTGPVKEILKLREESFVNGIKLGEVRLWNWDEFE